MKVPAHHWRECRPALLAVAPPGEEPELPSRKEAERQTVAMMAMWNQLPDEDRQAFHRVCCFNSRTPEDLRAIERIKQAMSEVL